MAALWPGPVRLSSATPGNKGTSEVATMLQLHVDARPEFIRPLRNAVARCASDTGLSDSQLYAVKLCVSEAVTNAVTHAYPENKPGRLDVCMREVADELEIVVADQGRESHRDPPPDHGGFGLGFISRLMSRCTFTADSDGTRVEMRFRLPRRRARPAHPPISERRPGESARLLSMPGRL
jgi:anti-sigma regulatory factor (Ser/Thr protein kinase)